MLARWSHVSPLSFMYSLVRRRAKSLSVSGCHWMTVQLKYRFNIFSVCSFHLSPLLLDIVSPLSLRSTTFCILFTVICNDFINATESWKLLLHFLSLSLSHFPYNLTTANYCRIYYKVGYANQTKSPAPIIQFRSANYDLWKWIELLVGRIEKPLHCTAV